MSPPSIDDELSMDIKRIIEMIVEIMNIDLYESHLKLLKYKVIKHELNTDILNHITTNQWGISNSAVKVQEESLK